MLIRASLTYAFALLLAGPAAAQAPKITEVTWLMPDIAPLSVPVAGKPTTGMADAVVLYLADKWQGPQQRVEFVNSKRAWTLLERGDKVCILTALRTPAREKIAWFRETNLSTPLQLVVRAEALPALQFDAQGRVDPRHLLAASGLRGLLTERRSFGVQLDAMLNAPGVDALVTRAPLGTFNNTRFRALLNGFYDYTIEYDSALGFAIAQDDSLSTLRTVPLAGVDDTLPGGVACPRNAWGREVIRKVDLLLGTKEGAQALSRGHMRWVTEDGRRRFGAELERYYRRLEKPLYPVGRK